MKSVELCVVNWSTQELIQESLPNIIENTDYPNFHVTVLDNCSIDNSWTKIREICYMYPGQVNAYQTHHNIGYGPALNIASRLTDADYLCFLNSDIFVDEKKDWITPLLETFDEIEDVGVVAPKLLNPDGLVNGHAVLGTNSERNMEWYWMQPDSERFNKALEGVTLCGAVMMIPRDLFFSVGCFDEQYRHYFEETDLTFTLRKEGYKCVCNPNSVLIHEHMASCQDQRLLQTHMAIGQALFHEKWDQFLKSPKEYTFEGVVG
jgi:GT2 family glycosyltransferase